MRIMDTAQKVRENRVRNTARRQGLTLVKTRVRDPMATGYGTYQLVDETTGQRAAKDVDDDYSNEWDDRQRRPTARALRQRFARVTLTLGEAETILKRPKTLVDW